MFIEREFFSEGATLKGRWYGAENGPKAPCIVMYHGNINFCRNHPTAHPLYCINLVILRDCVIVREANMGRLQFAI